MKYLSLLFAIAAATNLALFSDNDNSHTSYIYDSQYHGYQDNFSSPNPYQPPSTYFVPIDTPQDIARQRIHQQCEQLAHQQQRLSSPAYSAREMSAMICSGWSSSDFAQATHYATYEAMRQGKSPDTVERNLLNQYELYRIPAFREYIKTVPGYRDHIKNMSDRLVAQKPKRYKILRKLGLLDEQYVHELDFAEKLYAEILAEEKAEQRAAQQQQEAELYRQQEWLRCQQETTRVTFDQQRESLQTFSDEWTQIQDIYQDYGLCDNGRYERRKQALDSMTNGGCVYETKSYTASPAATQFIRDMGTDITEYQTCYGNQLQQVIHQECINGLDQLASLPETSVVYPYKESMALCFDAAREYNQAGSVDKATAIADFCASLLDYGKAIAEGAVSGVIGAVEDMLEHPGQALLCAVAGEYVLAYQLSKILYNVADIGVTYAFDRERGKEKWDEYLAPVTQLIDAIGNKELSLRDGLKGATQLAVQWKTQTKLLKGMNQFCKTAKARALEFAKNNPLAVPEQYMTTPEGILLQSTQNIQPPASGSSGSRLMKYTSSSKYFAANEQEVFELASKNNSVIQLPSATLQTIGKSSLNAPEDFFKHIFTAELIEKTFLTGTIKKNLAGFHHYIAEHLNEMGITLLNPRTCNKTGLIISDVLCDGHLEKRKTFFPASWSREQVILKIGESVQNLVKPPMVEGTKGVLFGQTSEGIIIRVVVDIQSGKYITAYPDALANNL